MPPHKKIIKMFLREFTEKKNESAYNSTLKEMAGLVPLIKVGTCIKFGSPFILLSVKSATSLSCEPLPANWLPPYHSSNIVS